MVAIFVALQIADVVITSIVIEREINPVAVALFDLAGVWPTMIGLKAALIWFATRVPRWLVNVATIVYGLVVINNLTAVIPS